MTFNSESAAYRVVVFPEPVGPVTRIIPFGNSITSRNLRIRSCDIPTLFKSSEITDLSRIRHTTLSPNIVGRTLTRKSTGFPATISRIRPSCGSRFSAISRLANTLIRVVIAFARCRGGGTISYKVPSALIRILNSSSKGSK